MTRVRRGRDEVDRQIWQRAHAGQAHYEQAAAGCQKPGDAGQGAIEGQVMEHGHQRDQVSFAVTGSGVELLEGAPADDHLGVLGQARVSGGGHARVSVDSGDACEVGAELPGEDAGPAADVNGGAAEGRQVTQAAGEPRGTTAATNP